MIISILAIVFFLAAILGNPAWQGEALYKVVKDFQTLIGAIIGFGALAWATRQGFKHSVASSEREAAGIRRRDAELRTQKARALAAALDAEIRTSITELDMAYCGFAKQSGRKWVNDKEQYASAIDHLRSRTPRDIYDANLIQLGLLDPAIVRAVTKFHADIVAFINVGHNAGAHYFFNDTYRNVFRRIRSEADGLVTALSDFAGLPDQPLKFGELPAKKENHKNTSAESDVARTKDE